MPSVKANAKSRGDRIKDAADGVSTTLQAIRDLEAQLDTLRVQRDALNEQIAAANQQRTTLLGDMRRSAGDLKAELDSTNV